MVDGMLALNSPSMNNDKNNFIRKSGLSGYKKKGKIPVLAYSKPSSFRGGGGEG